MPAETQAWVLGALLLGFAVKVPLFPFHTWLPLAHTEAPTAKASERVGTTTQAHSRRPSRYRQISQFSGTRAKM